MHYLLDKSDEFVADALLPDGRQAAPDFAGLEVGGLGGLGRHITSHSTARATSSSRAGRVSFVFEAGRGGVRLVASVGMRNTMSSW
jgi:hypothetical protein